MGGGGSEKNVQKTFVTKSICEFSLRVFNICAIFSEDVALPAQDLLLHRNLRMRRNSIIY